MRKYLSTTGRSVFRRAYFALAILALVGVIGLMVLGAFWGLGRDFPHSGVVAR